MWVAGAFGFALLALAAFLTVRYFKHEDTRLILCCWFTIAAAPATALGRAALGTPDFALAVSNRYGLFSFMVVCTLCLLIRVRLKVFKTRDVLVLVLLAGMFQIWAYREYHPHLDKMVKMRYALHNQDEMPVWGHAQR